MRSRKSRESQEPSSILRRNKKEGRGRNKTRLCQHGRMHESTRRQSKRKKHLFNENERKNDVTINRHPSQNQFRRGNKRIRTNANNRRICIIHSRRNRNRRMHKPQRHQVQSKRTRTRGTNTRKQADTERPQKRSGQRRGKSHRKQV